MKKVANEVGKLSFPKAPAAIGDRELARVSGGGTTTLDPCVRPDTFIPCIRPVLIVPCIRPG